MSGSGKKTNRSLQRVQNRQRDRKRQHTVDQQHKSCPASRISTDHDHEHEWVVFSTALEECCLMVQCVECGTHGTVSDPTEEEWSRAYYAPTKPYRWLDNARVTIREHGPAYVARSESNPAEYERIPRELMGKVLPVTQDEREELETMAEQALTGDLNGILFPLFIHSFERDTGFEFSGAVRGIASRLEQWGERGYIATSEEVAKALKWYAREAGHGELAAHDD